MNSQETLSHDKVQGVGTWSLAAEALPSRDHG